MTDLDNEWKGFPRSADMFFGLGLGSFFDGIVLHQILLRHHMVTSARLSTRTVCPVLR